MTTYEVFQPKMPLNAFPRETIAKQTQMFSYVCVHTFNLLCRMSSEVFCSLHNSHLFPWAGLGDFSLPKLKQNM